MKRYLLIVEFGEGQVLGPFRTDKDRLEVARTLSVSQSATYLRLDVREGRRPVVEPFSGGELEAASETDK